MNKIDDLIKGTWKEKHKKVIEEVLQFINNSSPDYILKGGTSLMECYGLNRFSEDIDFDSTNKNTIYTIIDNLAKKYGYNVRIAKDTDTVKRFMIDYGGKNEYGDKPLKVEISYRKKNIAANEIVTINGINVYNLDMIAIMKSGAYSSRDKIRDLYDLTFLVNNKLDQLNPFVIETIRNALESKGIEQFDYITQTQSDDLIDNDIFAEMFLNAFDKLNLISDKDNKYEQIQNKTNMQDDINEDIEL